MELFYPPPPASVPPLYSIPAGEEGAMDGENERMRYIGFPPFLSFLFVLDGVSNGNLVVEGTEGSHLGDRRRAGGVGRGIEPTSNREILSSLSYSLHFSSSSSLPRKAHLAPSLPPPAANE